MAEQDDTPFTNILPQPMLVGDSPQLQAQDRQARIQQNFANLNSQQSSWLPTALAVVGLLQGNVGPMMQLQEQKRRTALGVAMQPVMNDVQSLTSQGKWEEANELLENASMNVGARAPELVPLFQQSQKRIAEKQQQFENLKSVVMGLEAQGKGVDDPIIGPGLKFAKRALQTRTLADANILNNVLTRALQPHVQFINGQAVRQNVLSGELATEAIPQVVQPSDVNDIVGQLVTDQTGLDSTAQLTNVLNLKPGSQPIQTAKGQIIAPGSAEHLAVMQAHKASLPLRARFEAAKQTPREPIINTQLLGQGNDILDVALGGAPGEVTKALGGQQQRLVEAATAPIIAGLNLDPARMKNAGYVPVDADPQSPSYLRELDPMTYQNYVKGAGKFSLISTDIAQQVIPRIKQAITAFDFIPLLYQSGVDPNTPYNRAAQGIRDLFSQYLGINTGDDRPLRIVAQDVINRALEVLGSTEKIRAAEVGQLKSAVTGKFGSAEDAILASQAAKVRLNEMLADMARGATIQSSDMLKLIDQQYPGRGGPNQPPLPPELERIKKNYQEFQRRQGGQPATEPTIPTTQPAKPRSKMNW